MIPDTGNAIARISTLEGERDKLLALLREVRKGFRWPAPGTVGVPGGRMLFTLAHSRREAGLALLDKMDSVLGTIAADPTGEKG